MAMSNAVEDLLKSPLHVVNVGLEACSRDLEARGVDVVQVDWSPPAGGDSRLADLLAKLGR